MQGIYPTAPAGMQQPPEGGFAEGGEHVESPGKGKGPLSKVKHRARDLKAKLKKVAGSNTADTHDHENLNEHKLDQQARAYPSHANEYGRDDVDGDGKDSYDGDEEEEHILLGGDQSKYEQIHPIAAMDKIRDGPDLHDASHEQPKPGQLHDMPHTSYNHVPSGDISLDQHKPSPLDDMPYKSYDNAPTELSPSQHAFRDRPYAKEPEDGTFGAGALELPVSADAKRSEDHSYSPGTGMFSQRESQSPTASGLNVAYPDDIVKPNPEFGRSSSPIHKKIAVINEDLPAETRQESGLAPVKDFGIQQSLLDNAVPENTPINLEEADRSVDMPASETVTRPFLPSSGNVVPESNYAMTGGQKIGVTEQEDESGSPFTGGSGAGSFEKDKSESKPLTIGDQMGRRSKDDGSSLAEYASNKRDGSVDRQPVSDDRHPDTPSESDSSESTGILQGLRNTVTSTLGYGGLPSPKPSHEQDDRAQQAIPSELEQPNVAPHSQKQNGGALQGLKNVLASKLGYGAAKEPPNDQTVYDENEEHENEVKVEHTADGGVERDSMRKPAGDNAREAM